MIRSLFARRPSYRDELLAEAQSLVDDGLDVDVVLDLFPGDAEWLEPLLQTAEFIIDATGQAEPSYYFEASLKAKFIAAGEERAAELARPVPQYAAPVAPFRTAVAGSAVVALAGFAGVITLGFVTAGSAVPGDWNYGFKLAGERVEYVLATGDNRVTIELQHKQERVHEFQQQLVRGNLSEADVQRLHQELQELATLERESSLDPLQKASARAIGESSAEILTTAKATRPELGPVVDNAITVAAGIGGGGAVSAVDPIDDPDIDPVATETPVAIETATPQPSATATGTPEPTAIATETPTPTETPAGTLTPVETTTPEPSATATPAETGTAAPAAEATSTPPAATN